MTLFTPVGRLLPLHQFRQRLAEGADPNEIWRAEHGTSFVMHMPLLSAVRNKSPEYLKILLRHPRTDLQVADLQGRTALHMAAEYDQVQALRMLCEAGALNERDSNGRTPLFLAAKWGLHDIVRALLDQGADPDIPDDSGERPVDLVRRLLAQNSGLQDTLMLLTFHARSRLTAIATAADSSGRGVEANRRM